MRSRVSSNIRANARRLRKNLTHAEAILWRILKQLRSEGYHFRRQVPFSNYILDFAEHGQKLVVEIDGGQHFFPDHEGRDAIRDSLLRSEGYIVLRFTNHDVEKNLDGVVRAIQHFAPPTRPLRGHPPHKGEG